MQLDIKAVYEGASPYALAPVLVVNATGTLQEWQVLGLGLSRMQHQWPQWTVRVSSARPAVEHDTPVSVARGLVEWAKGVLNAVRGDVVEAGAKPLAEEGAVQVWLGYHVTHLSSQALKLAMDTAMRWGRESLTEEKLSETQAQVQTFGRHTRALHPDYQIRYVMQAARARGVPVLPMVREAKVWQVGWGVRRQLFFESATDRDSFIGSRLARNKAWSKKLLMAVGAPVVPHSLVGNASQLSEAVKTVGWPCVVKPLDRGGGKGVSADLRSIAALTAAYEEARQHTRGPVMVERHIAGDDHRLLVIGGRMVAAVRRAPSFVVGDGHATLRQLIDALNARRRQEQPEHQHWIAVVEDEAFGRHLANQGLTINGVPAPGQRVTLRSVSNVSMGGYLDYVSDSVHPKVRAMAESIAALSGLHTIGLDYITTDIERDWHEVSGAFVEINTTPGLDGLDRHPGRAPGWLGDVLLGEAVGRIPVLCILMAKADWPCWRPHMPALLGDAASGASGPQWVWANGMSWQAERLNANQAAQMMLRHATVKRAVVVVVSDDLPRLGFPVDGVSRLAVVGDILPDQWQAVALKIADKVMQIGGLDQLEKEVRDWLGLESRQPVADLTSGPAVK